MVGLVSVMPPLSCRVRAYQDLHQGVIVMGLIVQAGGFSKVEMGGACLKTRQGPNRDPGWCLESGGNSSVASSDLVDLCLIKRRGQGLWARSVCRGFASRRSCAC